MGSGSSRSGRALRRLRGPDSRPAGPGGAASEGGTRRRRLRGRPDPGPRPGPAAPPDGGDETLRLLDQLLAEVGGLGPGRAGPAGPDAAPTRSRRPEPGECRRGPSLPITGPDGQSDIPAVSYDYSEEALMASIDHYCLNNMKHSL
uniref:Uncharacterized protein n=1 Tax=Lynx canadensis TaxID=61383 RepID=A0A667GSF8_LYNCA